MLKKFCMQLFGLALTCAPFLSSHAQSDGCCSPCHFNSCKDVFWAEADYLYWKVQDSPKVIPLVIEQSVPNGQFDVVLGGKKIKRDWHSGAKFTVGYWFDTCNQLGAEISYFFLGKHSKNSHVESNSNGSPRLRVQFFNVNINQLASSAIATPGIFRGGASLKTSNTMQGAEANLIKECSFGNFSNVKILAGFRYWNFEDHLKFYVNSPLVAFPTVYEYYDKFCTDNNFYGGQIGVYFRKDFCSFFYDVRGKVALGANCQKSTIKGQFETNEFNGSVQTFQGGFFALPTNIGNHKKTRFTTLVDVALNIGYHITENCSIRLGYSALYITEVARASKQMNNKLNPTQSANIEFTPTPVLLGQASPLAKLKSTGLWTQGVNAGFDFTF